VKWRLCGRLADLPARSTTMDKLHADWGI